MSLEFSQTHALICVDTAVNITVKMRPYTTIYTPAKNSYRSFMWKRFVSRIFSNSCMIHSVTRASKTRFCAHTHFFLVSLQTIFFPLNFLKLLHDPLCDKGLSITRFCAHTFSFFSASRAAVLTHLILRTHIRQFFFLVSLERLVLIHQLILRTHI